MHKTFVNMVVVGCSLFLSAAQADGFSRARVDFLKGTNVLAVAIFNGDAADPLFNLLDGGKVARDGEGLSEIRAGEALRCSRLTDASGTSVIDEICSLSIGPDGKVGTLFPRPEEEPVSSAFGPLTVSSVPDTLRPGLSIPNLKQIDIDAGAADLIVEFLAINNRPATAAGRIQCAKKTGRNLCTMLIDSDGIVVDAIAQ